MNAATIADDYALSGFRVSSIVERFLLRAGASGSAVVRLFGSPSPVGSEAPLFHPVTAPSPVAPGGDARLVGVEVRDRTTRDTPGVPRVLVETLLELRGGALEAEVEARPLLERLEPETRRSAANLLHYLSLRSHDLRELQEDLARAGLSSLGRSEAHVLATLEAVLDVAGVEPDRASSAAPTFDDGRSRLSRETFRLLGASRGRRRIMVTIPSDGAVDPEFAANLVAAGMDCARVNTAHEDLPTWEAMVAAVRGAAERAARECRVLVDLQGPKLRTGALEAGPAVVKLRPTRNAHGQVTAPARFRILRAEIGQVAGGVPGFLASDPDWVDGVAVGDEIGFVDARGSRRALTVVDAGRDGLTVACAATAYMTPTTRLARPSDDAAVTLAVPARLPELILSPGDVLVLTRDQTPGGCGPDGPRVPCTLPEAFRDVRAGERAWFDDGRIGGTVVGVSVDEIHVRIEQARADGSRLRAEKGINLPDTALGVPALSDGDLDALPFVARAADAVSLSFAQDPDDVRELRQHLDALGAHRVGIVLKIETRRGFARLPELLLALLESPAPRGVMIARGDLAVECGWERLAEVQEEILWLAEASHTPVIWATQVLETLAKTGRPSRAEITDAAMGARAECVMLNKGPRILDAVVTLADILDRMSDHVRKKTPLLRRLHTWNALSDPE